MILALLYSFIPSVILGRKKIPKAKILHNKLLIVDAETQKADWLTALAAILGIIGLGIGIWWADAAAAIFISFDIVKDGITRTSGAIKDFLGKIPTTAEEDNIHPVNEEIIKFFENQPWIKDLRIRMREEGQVFFGEAYVIPVSEIDLVENIAKCYYEIKKSTGKFIR